MLSVLGKGRMDRFETTPPQLRPDGGFSGRDVLALRATRCMAFFIGEALLDLDPVDVLTRMDRRALLKMGRTVDLHARNSFYQADLIVECKNRDDGSTEYLAVAASYTADQRDSDQALCNAALLAQCTGAPAHAVVSSVQKTPAVQDLVDSGELHWYRLTNEDLQPD